MIHRIRLRGPWEVRSQSEARSVSLPYTLQDVGVVTFHRSFGRPVNLDSNEQVWLVIDEVKGFGSLELNGEPIGTAIGRLAIDVTTRLLERNKLTIEFESSDQEVGVLGAVALEIRTIPPPTSQASQSSP